MKKTNLVSLCLIIPASCLCLALSACEKAPEGPAPAKDPVKVKVVALQSQDVNIEMPLNGSVSAFGSADIRPQVSGIIREQLFTGGEEVKKGQPLYQIDDRPFKNKYDYYQASYLEASAKYDLAKAKLERYNNLAKSHSVSSQDLDDVKSAHAEAEAQKEISRANFNDAKLDLEYTKVLSPIDGIVGISAVTGGALVTANQTDALTTVVDISRVYVDLQIGSDAYRRWQNALRRGKLIEPDGGFKVRVLFDGNEKAYPEGLLKFSGVTVDESTGNLTLRSIFNNPGHVLLPGMNVQAQIDTGFIRDVILLREDAITRDPKGNYYVYTVNDGKASRVKVSLQPITHARYLVLDGLNPGDSVVVSGKNQLKNGTAVVVED